MQAFFYLLDFYINSPQNSVLLFCIKHCVDIVIYIKGYREENDQFIAATFIMLDSLIGEYDVGVKLGEINFEPYQEEKEAQPILNLVSLVDKL